MKDFEALKNIWHGQAELTGLSYEEVLHRIRNTRSTFSRTLLVQLVLLSLSILTMLIILLNIPFRLGTSQLAIVIYIVCCISYLLIQVRDYRKITHSESLLGVPDDYIAWLKSYKQSRYVLNTRVYRIYMLFMGIGILFYFIELFVSVSLWQTLMAVAFTVGWFVFCYFVIVKIYIRKEEARLNEMIRNLERLRRQFTE